MTKTPEELAEEWANAESDLWFADISTYTDGHKSAVKQAYLAGYQAAQQWISVKDRLPKIGEWVLINGPEVCQRVAPPSSSWDWEFAWATDHHSFYEPTDIHHWMPLPKPPTKEES